MSQFEWRVKQTPSGRYYVKVMLGEMLVATGRFTHETGEQAVNEMIQAYRNRDLLRVANVTAEFLKIMGKDGKGKEVISNG